MAADMMVGVAGTAVAAVGMQEAVIRAALGGMALVRGGITLALDSMGVVVIGTAAGIVGVVAGIMVVTAVVGELVPQLVLMLALDYSGERSQRVPITAAMTMAMITRLMPVRLGLRFGIGAIPIRRITLPYPNAQFLGEKLFNNGLKNFGSRYAAFRIFRLRLDRCAPASKDLPSSGMPLRQRARSYGTPLGSQPIG